jgi:anti-repressor protein
MNELINGSSAENEQNFTSLKLAEVSGKRHDNVLKDIADESAKLGTEIAALIFEGTSYTDKSNRQSQMYNLTEKGWLQMGARYDAQVRYAIIDYAEKTHVPKPMTLLEALQIGITAEKGRLAAVKQLELQAPKIKVFDTITNSNRLSTVNEVAGSLNIGRNTFFGWLRDQKYIYTQKNQGSHKPYQKYLDAGLMQYKVVEFVKPNGKIALTYQPLFTGKGIAFISAKWCEDQSVDY